jgi:D-amino peptidase
MGDLKQDNLLGIMKFFIAVDCEGVACAVGAPGGTLNDSPNYEFARLQATREANAAAQGLFEAGATEVIVCDAHSSGVNLHYDLLDERCLIANGAGSNIRFPGMDSTFQGVVFVGYHAMDSTLRAVMCHTYSSIGYQYMKVNGDFVGELAMDAAVAGEMGVPALFVASDDKCIAEAKRFFPSIQTVTTKQSLGWNSALSKHPLRVVKEIQKEVVQAVKRRTECKPFRFKNPLEIEVRYKRIEAAEGKARQFKNWKHVDAYTVQASFESISDFF